MVIRFKYKRTNLMHKHFFNLLIILVFSSISTAWADVNNTKVSPKPSQLELIRDALEEFSHTHTKNSVIYDQKRREMLDNVEQRFYACDPDNDNTLDVYEVTQCLPQVARQFRKVDIDNDNVITLDELSILAKDYHEKQINKYNVNVVSDKKLNDSPAASLKK